ncbi:MAG: EAL domain-containing protein [Alphaproteobacteria bacterium]|nr:EAL domain-containing protein [Alphaproteobacteria bacterium]
MVSTGGIGPNFMGHELPIAGLAMGIGLLGSFAAINVGRHALRMETTATRRLWLMLAGFVTGFAVWGAHFVAILGYRNDLDIRYDLTAAVISVGLSVLVCAAAWLLGFMQRERGALAGGIIGLSVAIAHFADLRALRVAGTVDQDYPTSLLAIAVSVALGAWSGHLLVSRNNTILAWPAVVALFMAMMSFHLIAMTGVSISPGNALLLPPHWTATSDELTSLVVGTFLTFLAVALIFVSQAAVASRASKKERRHLHEALRVLAETQAHYRAYVEVSPQIGWVADPQGRVIEIAPLWTELVGIPGEEALDEGWTRAIHPNDLPLVLENWRNAVKSSDHRLANTRYRMRLSDGSFKWFQIRARPRRDADGNIAAWYGSMEDIQDQVIAETALRTSEERFRFASCATNDIIWDWSVDDQKTTWAGDYLNVLGYPELEEGTTQDWWVDRIHPDDAPRLIGSQDAAIAGGEEYWNDEYRFKVVSGEWIDIKSCCLIVRDDTGRYIRLVGSMLDITEQKRAQIQLVLAAHHDSLTGLPNRARYLIDIGSAIDAAKRTNRFVALILIDLNRFKILNDTLGHAVGDKVLQELAERLSNIVPEGATIARMGGDEFAVVLPNLATEVAADPIVNRLERTLTDPVAVADMSIPIALSAGIAVYPRDGREPSDLLHAADLALYSAKDRSPGTFTEFSPALRARADTRSTMLSTARAALESDRIVPFYQPKIDLRTGQVDGWEALLRIRDAEGQILSPCVIGDAFEDGDLSGLITDRMLSLVFADLAQWQAAGIDPGQIAVNVSAGDLLQVGLIDRLKVHATAHGQAISKIAIEVTENVLIGRASTEIFSMFKELQAHGVGIALDDFGTGYASLTHLLNFPVDVMKLDRSFVEQIDENDLKSTAIINAMLQMARLLEIKTVAEGVETTGQARYLQTRGCNSAQGYLFSHPIAFANVQAVLAQSTLEHWEFAALPTQRRSRGARSRAGGAKRGLII